MIQDDLSFTLGEIRKAIPQELFKKSEIRFLVSLGFSLSLTLGFSYLGFTFIPLNWMMLPVWIVFSIISGTIATGIWVLGHECGHGSFSDNWLLNDILGYILHTILLVPYFSWQHSHSVHHAKTNHLTEGETHVPNTNQEKMGKLNIQMKDIIGADGFAIYQIINLGLIGWPIYLLTGVTGGPARGWANHFVVPTKLFPMKFMYKVNISTFGIGTMIYVLYIWSQQRSLAEVFALYIGPYMVVNMWLVFITYLQHTDKDVPHYDNTTWTWLKGALCTVDRNYPLYIDALHHSIGTTHVLHHLFSDIPHYNAHLATIYMKQIIAGKYNYDKQNIWKALYSSAKLCAVSNNGKGEWYY